MISLGQQDQREITVLLTLPSKAETTFLPAVISPRGKKNHDRTNLASGLGQVLDTCPGCQAAAALQLPLHSSRVFPCLEGKEAVNGV